ncbi:putative RNA polymerase II subunit B1 CTD phosphatase RPAP2 homolog [Contarinia nasturtii]|uniref:putative RNA polymerase II subunit B1 CTD phosphatase RPAP2 homolog n=1 Tax=Contarinia nasturtii TaxID=265458 RepID=UPI0012D4BEF3|nr:putative RNA polymerase II subunit B1 CTD phosphatase RPAP2 homolog [Contarinia nasturtii]
MEPGKPKQKPKTPPTKRKTKASNLSKEQLLAALQKKKECNVRAQKIVESFLDPVPIDKIEYFLSNLIHINQSHYDDIVEERSISKLCGYPLCDNILKEIPKQQYIISSAQNKVFDITERKKFCSNKCYKSSIYLKEQILTSPLWIRKDDDIIPEFKLLSFEDADKSDTSNKEDKTETHGDNEQKLDNVNACENKNDVENSLSESSNNTAK